MEAGTKRPVVIELRASDPLAMTKRVAAAFLWFYTGWYAGAFLAELLGVSPVIGPIVGAAAAGFFVGDPLRIIWTRPAPRPSPRPPRRQAGPGLSLPAPRIESRVSQRHSALVVGRRGGCDLVHELQGEGAEVHRAVDVDRAAPDRQPLRDEVGLE